MEPQDTTGTPVQGLRVRSDGTTLSIIVQMDGREYEIIRCPIAEPFNEFMFAAAFKHFASLLAHPPIQPPPPSGDPFAESSPFLDPEEGGDAQG
jgi:hypothetical protein